MLLLYIPAEKKIIKISQIDPQFFYEMTFTCKQQFRNKPLQIF